ncbi:MAG: MBL fold metallo-hydrolase [Deltaproteobacteria bacterium]|nr:MBL fold metallo-hydrolase [Deltaproteobacteria bacterium]
MIFRQLFDSASSTFTYLLADPKTKETLLIDPVLENVDRDLKVINELNLKLICSLDTHIHADHITGAAKLRELTQCKTGIGAGAHLKCADFSLKDGEIFKLGSLEIKAIATPGHTNSCTSYFCSDRVFTGDALLIRGCGRTDFQEGSAETLYASVTQKLFKLPGTTLVFPAHDYKGMMNSSIAEEMEFNPRLGGGKTKEEFVSIMSQLKLDPPKKISEAVPANRGCGRLTSPL